MRTLKNVAGSWRIASLKTKRQNSDRKQQSFALKVGWRVESNQQRNREVVTQCHTRRAELRAARHRRLQQGAQRQAVASSSSAAAERFQSEVPDHGVKRERWSPQVQDTSELGPSESRVRPQGLKRQPESTREDLEDAGDQCDADDEDMNALGAVCEETRDDDRSRR